MSPRAWFRALLERRRTANMLPGSRVEVRVFRRRRGWLPGVRS